MSCGSAVISNWNIGHDSLPAYVLSTLSNDMSDSPIGQDSLPHVTVLSALSNDMSDENIGHDSLPYVLSALSNDMSDFDWLFIWHILDTTHCFMRCLHSAMTCLISTASDCLFGTYWTWLTAWCAVCAQQWRSWFTHRTWLTASCAVCAQQCHFQFTYMGWLRSVGSIKL